MNKSTIEYKRTDSLLTTKSWYNYSMFTYISCTPSEFPIRIIKRITNENITD